MARKHKEDEVLKKLSLKKDVRIVNGEVQVLKDTVWSTKEQKTVVNPKKHFDLGNGSWGKIDFLVNHCGYSLVFTNS